jgi:sugar porter (SP) family MFS transporter
MSRFVVLAAAIAAVGGMLFGYDTGVISGAILFIHPDFGLDTTQVELVVSAVLVGATIGAIGSARLTDALGRRTVLMAAAACFGAGAIAGSLAPSAGVLVIARLVLGLAIGVSSYAVPLYIAELAPPRSRGWLVSLNQLAITIGILISYGVDYFLSASGAWRWMLGLAAVPAALLLVGVALLPDTPGFLLHHGQIDAARRVLFRLRGGDDVEHELAEIESVVRKPTGRWSELLAPRTRTALVVGVGLAIFQQVTGINTVIYYAPTIIQLAGVPSAAGAILASAGIGAINVLLTVAAMLLLDRIGRRPMLIGGMVLMAATLAALGLTFRFVGQTGDLGVVSVVWLMLYVGAFAISLGPIFWLIIAEIYPLRVRGLAMGVATTANWASNLLVSLTFLTLTDVIGLSRTFWLYGLLTIAAVIFAYKLVPETKGRTLEAIEKFGAPAPAALSVASEQTDHIRDRAA